jgi:hypothetical protein
MVIISVGRLMIVYDKLNVLAGVVNVEQLSMNSKAFTDSSYCNYSLELIINCFMHCCMLDFIVY